MRNAESRRHDEQSACPSSPVPHSYLHVIQRYYPYIGGSELYFGVLSAWFARRGDRVTVYTTDAWDLEHFWANGKRRIDGSESPREHEGARIRRFAVRHPPLWWLGYPVTRRLMTHLSDLPFSEGEALLREAGRFSPWVPSLERALRDEEARFDLVHSANIALESLILAAEGYARRRDVPHIVTPFVHLAEEDRRQVSKYYTMRHQLGILRRADAVVAQTASERRFLLAQGIAEERLHLIGAGVDPATVTGGDGAAFRERYGISGPLVAILGTTAYDKGTVHLVEALLALRNTGREVTLAIAGPTMEHFVRWFATLSPSDRAHCRLFGFISPDEKRDLLAAADIYAGPSRTDSFGISYLEAWCCGLPVIGARAGGVPDVIDHGEDGLLVPFGDVPALTEALRSLLDDPALAAHLGARGRAKTLAQHTWEQVATAFAGIYDSVVG